MGYKFTKKDGNEFLKEMKAFLQNDESDAACHIDFPKPFVVKVSRELMKGAVEGGFSSKQIKDSALLSSLVGRKKNIFVSLGIQLYPKNIPSNFSFLRDILCVVKKDNVYYLAMDFSKLSKDLDVKSSHIYSSKNTYRLLFVEDGDVLGHVEGAYSRDVISLRNAIDSILKPNMDSILKGLTVRSNLSSAKGSVSVKGVGSFKVYPYLPIAGFSLDGDSINGTFLNGGVEVRVGDWSRRDINNSFLDRMMEEYKGMIRHDYGDKEFLKRLLYSSPVDYSYEGVIPSSPVIE